jgi:hypothetical protein
VLAPPTKADGRQERHARAVQRRADQRKFGGEAEAGGCPQHPRLAEAVHRAAEQRRSETHGEPDRPGHDPDSA